MKKLQILSFFTLISILFCFSNCKKNVSPFIRESNIELYNKPLYLIQAYIQGNWKFQYAKGGICGSCIFPSKKNEYMIINSNKIVFGDDSAGVVLDTKIYWKRDNTIFNYSTYLLTYYYPSGAGPFPVAYIVNRYHNDTLELIDNANDPIYYYYTIQ